MTNIDPDETQTANDREETEAVKGDTRHAPAPPANPPLDEESHEKGKEQLGKIVGN